MPSVPSTSSDRLTMIVAIACGGVIGKNGKLPWDLPEDHAFFLETTRGHAVIMGHATFDEEGRALPDRRNLVVSRNPNLVLPGAEVFPSVDRAIESARRTDEDPFVIGGAEVFRAALPYVTRIFVTEIDRTFEGDTTFFLDRSGFREVARRRGTDPTLSFVTLERSPS